MEQNRCSHTEEVHAEKGECKVKSRTEPLASVGSIERFNGRGTRGSCLNVLLEEFAIKPREPLPSTHPLVYKQHSFRVLFGKEYVTSEMDKYYYLENDHLDFNLAKSSM